MIRGRDLCDTLLAETLQPVVQGSGLRGRRQLSAHRRRHDHPSPRRSRRRAGRGARHLHHEIEKLEAQQRVVHHENDPLKRVEQAGSFGVHVVTTT